MFLNALQAVNRSIWKCIFRYKTFFNVFITTCCVHTNIQHARLPKSTRTHCFLFGTIVRRCILIMLYAFKSKINFTVQWDKCKNWCRGTQKTLLTNYCSQLTSSPTSVRAVLLSKLVGRCGFNPLSHLWILAIRRFSLFSPKLA